MLYARFVAFWQLMTELRMETAVPVQAVHTMIASLNNRNLLSSEMHLHTE